MTTNPDPRVHQPAFRRTGRMNSFIAVLAGCMVPSMVVIAVIGAMALPRPGWPTGIFLLAEAGVIGIIIVVLSMVSIALSLAARP